MKSMKYNDEETCCFNCGSWTYIKDIKHDGFGNYTCPLCRDDGKETQDE